jgi:hypothetical protein
MPAAVVVLMTDLEEPRFVGHLFDRDRQENDERQERDRVD